MLICATQFIQKLKDNDLNYRVVDTDQGDIVVDFPYEGKVTKCIFSGEIGEYFSMYLVYERIPKEKALDLIILCNTLNAEFKWITCYVDNDNDLIMHNDAIVSPDSAAEECFELLIRMLNISAEMKPRIMKAIYV